MARAERSIRYAVFSIAALAASPAFAQSCSATISAINYGTGVDVLPGAAIDTAGTLTVSCVGTANRTVRICANLGRGNPAPVAAGRRMLGATTSTFINYELYANAGYTQIWGSWRGAGYASGGVQFDVPLNAAGSGITSRTIYARILAGQQTARPDSYSATLTGNTHSWSDQYVSLTNPNNPTCPFGGYSNYASTAVNGTIPGLCYMNITGVNFGTHTALTSAVPANGTIAPQCSNLLPYTVSLGGGLSGATDPTQRKLAQGAKQVTYGLYRDASFLLPWGSTTGVNTATGVGTGLSQSMTVYGRLPVQAVPASGVFSDSVVVTITY